jgi:hypothetical protein
LSDGKAAKSKLEPRLLDPTLDHPPFAVDQLQFGQAQQKANMIEALGGALPSELVVLSHMLRHACGNPSSLLLRV